jgi:hypothetical protein
VRGRRRKKRGSNLHQTWLRGGEEVGGREGVRFKERVRERRRKRSGRRASEWK